VKGRVWLFLWIWDDICKWHALVARLVLQRNPNKKTSFRPASACDTQYRWVSLE